jgi:phage baseplate assembly protein W
VADASDAGFLGRGWSFPPKFDIDARGVEMTEKEVDIDRSLQILLTTAVGERVMLPQYGCDLQEHVFDSMNRTMKTLVEDRIKTAILYYEPRIDAKRIDLDDSEQSEGRLVVRIDYVVRATNSRHNVVFPFYLAQGTERGFLTGTPFEWRTAPNR